MQTWKFAALAVGLVLTSSAALAFQQQNGGAAPQTGAAPVAQEAAKGGGIDAGQPVELAPADVGGKSGVAGTEVRIPGLGKLGVLPKMDFGLELLYGAAESKRSSEPQRETGSEDVTIRGTLKHRF